MNHILEGPDEACEAEPGCSPGVKHRAFALGQDSTRPCRMPWFR